jgi:CobQ-like glutamine amidotransferase family enzyme
LYADLLNLYADRGNVMSLRRRCEWRGIDFEVVPLSIGDRITPGSCDIAFMGGGQDGDQAFLADDLFRVKADGIRGLIADGVPLLAVCGSYQLLGHYYDPATGPRLPGLGVFDLHTAHPGTRAARCIGNVVAEWKGAPSDAPSTLVGFENHGGRTWLGFGASPFARIVTGFGNNGADRTEGIVVGNAIGTYIHGSLLPKNPHLADRLISLALDPSGATGVEPLDDSIEWRAHETVLGRFAPDLRGSTEGWR